MSRIATLLAVVLVASGCASGSGSSAPDSTDGAPVGGDVQSGIDWFVDAMNGAEFLVVDYESRVAPVLREEVAFDSFLSVLSDLRRRAPFTVVERAGFPSIGYAIAESDDGGRFRVSAHLDGEGRFEGLLVARDSFPEMANPPESPQTAVLRLEQVAPADQVGRFGGVVAETTNGACEVLAAVRADDPIPLGSAFKLYVLGSLALEILDGSTSWEAPIEITDGVRSIPGGTLRARPTESTVTAQEAAALMIAVSDNTAADLIIRYLGRSVVESRLSDLGMQDPSITLPFLTTKEFGSLKVAVDDDVREAYITGTEADRRAILESIAGVDVADIPVEGFVAPVAVNDIEWFATPNDLCRLGVELRELSERTGLEPLAQVLSLNPGIPDPEGRWDSIWFKGGSEPGLLAAWWSVRDEADREYVLAGSHVNPAGTVDADAALLVWGATRELLVAQEED